MKQKMVSAARIRCKNCGMKRDIAPDEFDYASEVVAERNMGAEIEEMFSVNVSCECGCDLAVNISMYQYPVGIYNEGPRGIANDMTEILEMPRFDEDYRDDIDDMEE